MTNTPQEKGCCEEECLKHKGAIYSTDGGHWCPCHSQPQELSGTTTAPHNIAKICEATPAPTGEEKPQGIDRRSSINEINDFAQPQEEENVIEAFRLALAQILKHAKSDFCPGCGLSLEGFDRLLAKAKAEERERLKENTEGLMEVNEKNTDYDKTFCIHGKPFREECAECPDLREESRARAERIDWFLKKWGAKVGPNADFWSKKIWRDLKHLL